MRDFGAQLKTVEGNEGGKCKYPTRLDTYGCGCAHDCTYCYAKSLLDFRGLWNPKAPAVGEIGQISREVRKIPRGTVVRLGGMTDCFQPIERLHRTTYKTIRLLNKRGIPYLIVTKSALVAEPEYLKILDPELAHVQITVTTLDDALCATYEKASPPTARIKAIDTLQKQGIDVQLRLSPYIPEYIDIDALNELAPRKILVEFLRANSWIQKWFATDYSAYTVSQNGYRHLPLDRKKMLLSRIKGYEEISVCEDETEAYEYWRDNVNNNPEDCCNLRRA